MGKITFVVLFYGKPELTRRCIGSLLRSEGFENGLSRAQAQLLLVDNGSINSHKSIFQSLPPSTDCVKLAANRGFAGGMNEGLRSAFGSVHTDLCVLLSNDVEVDSSFWKHLTSSNLYQEEGIFCPIVYRLKRRDLLAYSHGRFDCEKQSFSSLQHLSESITKISPPLYYPAAVTIWTRKAFEKLNGFDEAYPCYWEDVDLSWRCWHHQIPLVHRPDLKVFHLGKGTTAGKKKYLETFAVGESIFRSRWGQ